MSKRPQFARRPTQGLTSLIVRQLPPSWVIYGPQGSGKSFHAAALAKALGVARVIHEWDGTARTYVAYNALHLCDSNPPFPICCLQVESIESAIKRLASHARPFGLQHRGGQS